MENSLKQRIIGAIVLVALGIIFLPSILKEKTSNGVFKTHIPKKPKVISDYEMDTYKIDDLLAEENKKALAIIKEAEEIESRIEQKSDAEMVEVESDQDLKEDKSTSREISKEQSTSEGAWIIQVASFSKQENAIMLVDRLKANKHKAYKSKAVIDNDVVYRVFVGPYINKTIADKAISNIDKVSGTNAILKVFNPINH